MKIALIPLLALALAAPAFAQPSERPLKLDVSGSYEPSPTRARGSASRPTSTNRGPRAAAS